MPAQVQTISETEGIKEVLQRLGELNASEDPTADDAALVRKHYLNVYNSWYIKGWATWAYEALPPEAMHGFCAVVAARCRPHFQGTSIAEVIAEERAAEQSYFRDNPWPESDESPDIEFF